MSRGIYLTVAAMSCMQLKSAKPATCDADGSALRMEVPCAGASSISVKFDELAVHIGK